METLRSIPTNHGRFGVEYRAWRMAMKTSKRPMPSIPILPLPVATLSIPAEAIVPTQTCALYETAPRLFASETITLVAIG